jgi:hypothetical protein
MKTILFICCVLLSTICVAQSTTMEANKLHAKQSLAMGAYDTTTAPRWAGGELRYKSSNKTIYFSNGNTSGQKWFPIIRTNGEDTLANDITYDSLLMNPSTKRYVFKSLNNISSGGLTTTKTLTSGTIQWSTVLGGTLSAQTDILGAAQALNLGTSGSNLSSLTVNASADFVINSGIKVSYPTHSADGTLTMSANAPSLLLDDAALTANRTVTLPTGAVGNELEITNKGNNATFFYQFSPTPTDNATGSTVTNIGHRTSYKLKKDAGGWRIVFKY